MLHIILRLDGGGNAQIVQFVGEIDRFLQVGHHALVDALVGDPGQDDALPPACLQHRREDHGGGASRAEIGLSRLIVCRHPGLQFQQAAGGMEQVVESGKFRDVLGIPQPLVPRHVQGEAFHGDMLLQIILQAHAITSRALSRSAIRSSGSSSPTDRRIRDLSMPRARRSSSL